MNVKSILNLSLALIALGWLAGCATPPAVPAAEVSETGGTVSAEKFTYLDRQVQNRIECTALHERLLPDGRIEVVAMLRNRTAEPVKVQLNCVFKDAQGFSTGDETPFQAATIVPGTTEAVRFIAANATARNFTVRMRLAR
ncbi:MAG: hypothetical protein RLZZ129_1395 [Verrucomicrobiota bacterium]|jgi:uncharacterized protein YcfL